MPIAKEDFDYIRAYVRSQAAIVLEPGKEYLVECRLAPLARSNGMASIADLVSTLRRKPENGLHRQVIEAMTTNETSFFRDVTPFEAMRTHVVPDLMKRRATTRKLRIWCAASSTGQEPYSLAMLLLEHFPALGTWDVRIHATDIARDILDKARAGRYSQLEVNRGLPAPMLARYFERAGTEWQIKDVVKKMVSFSEVNLVRPWVGVGIADIVFIRNVLIYFDVPTKREILGRIRSVLTPDGYLFLGSVETTLEIDASYQRMPIGRATCYRPAGVEVT
jgi:chemotaxis protein methyltransferase CheR